MDATIECSSPIDKQALNQLLGVFPFLREDKSACITSHRTDEYNCIAWAMGTDEWWIDPREAPGHWWPAGVPKDMRSSSLIRAFERVGFARCGDAAPEEGYDKIALYKDEQHDCWTHAARVLSAEVYHSKMGQSFDIRHRGGDIFRGSTYGMLYAFMKRPKKDGHLTADRISESEGTIEFLYP